MGLSGSWLLLGAFVAVLTSFAAGVIHGHRAERKTWEVVIAKQRFAAADLMAKSEAARRETEQVLQNLKDKTELDHATQETRINAAYAANRMLLARGGLYDIKGNGNRTGRCDVVPTNSNSPSGAANLTAGCQLSAETSATLLDLARDADRAAAYARTCRQWALGIGDVSSSTP